MPSSRHSQANLALESRFPHRVSAWQLRNTKLQFGRRPRLMAIVNVTPDSFSDGGRYFSTDKAVELALRLVEQGADVIDVGGESTRPYATPVAVTEELERVIPVIEQVTRISTVPISIDTSKAVVAQEALNAGAQAINDVTGLAGDPKMLEVALEYGCGVCVMHMQGDPRTMQNDPQYDDVVDEIGRYLTSRRDTLEAAGISRDRICLDPGIGFGKTHQHNLTLMAHCGEFHRLACPLLIGHSRKGFIAKLLGSRESDRLAATVGASLALAHRGIQMLRVHDVKPIRDALLLYESCGGIDGHERQLESDSD